MSGTWAVATTWNGGVCGVCAARYLGSHTCSVDDLLRRSSELLQLARETFDRQLDAAEPIEVADVNLPDLHSRHPLAEDAEVDVIPEAPDG